jgi:hypothetical protein
MQHQKQLLGLKIYYFTYIVGIIVIKLVVLGNMNTFLQFFFSKK